LKNKNLISPYRSGRGTKNETCLATLNSEVAKQWHPTKNGILTPYDVSEKSQRKVWWLCDKGELCVHEWTAVIKNRTSNKSGCPFCSGNKVCLDNCLATKNPEVAKQWHPTKNGDLTPFDVLSNSHKVVWWLCDKGELSNHDWKATPNGRQKRGCPFCTGQKACLDNCLATKNLERAKYWHPTKNGSRNPNNITAGSNKLFWWMCEKGHEWKAPPSRRIQGSGCKYCNGGTSFLQQMLYFYVKQVFEGTSNKVSIKINNKVKEADIFIPEIDFIIEYDGGYWHKGREKEELEKDNLFLGKGYNVLRIREKGLDKPLNKKVDFIFCDAKKEEDMMGNLLLYLTSHRKVNDEQKQKISDIDININRDRNEIISSYKKSIKEKSFMVTHPKLAVEWFYEKNKFLEPEMFTYGSYI
jgi:very-short-patch-repair endonuclease